jgi:FtsP/CotA-like multicopper oxidase with cupredoxin domain
MWMAISVELGPGTRLEASGVFKDVINVPRYQNAEVDFVADNPGLSCFIATCNCIRTSAS